MVSPEIQRNGIRVKSAYNMEETIARIKKETEINRVIIEKAKIQPE